MLSMALFTFTYHRLITHETLWSFILSSSYLISIFIIDTSLYVFNSTKIEKFNSYIRNTYSVIVYSFCYAITIEFWLILSCGLLFGKNPFSDTKKISTGRLLESLYLHLGITIIMILDLFFSERKVDLNKKNLKIINFIFMCYSVVVLITNYVLIAPAYPFMKDASATLIVAVFVLSFAILNGSYFIHIFLIRKINKTENKKLN